MKAEDILTEFELKLPQKQVDISPKLSSEENAVFIRLRHKLIYIDEICTQMQKDTPEIHSTLLLELKNLIQQHPGKLLTKSV